MPGADVAKLASTYSTAVYARSDQLVQVRLNLIVVARILFYTRILRAQFQLFAMFFEAHCHLIVMKDRLFRRVDAKLVEVQLQDALDSCHR